MIVVEDRILEIVSGMPVITLNDEHSSKPFFHWGDRHELEKYLSLMKEDTYPLIWLMPSKDLHIENGRLCIKECTFIIATRETRKDLLNNERYELSYKLILNPVLDHLVQGLGYSTISRFTDGEYEVERLPDFTESYYKNDNDNYTIDLWDAIKLTCEVEFNDNCLNQIIWTS